MLTFISNLYFVLRNFPSAITIIKTVMDIIGSQAVQNILEAVRDAVRTEQRQCSIEPITEPQRKRFVQRVRDRIALQLLGLRREQMPTLQAFCDLNTREIA